MTRETPVIFLEPSNKRIQKGDSNEGLFSIIFSGEFQEIQPLFCDVHVFPNIRYLRNKIWDHSPSEPARI
jgi:hypothetical protein